MTIPRLPGTYALVFHIQHPIALSVGRLGELRLRPGYYVYVGSARGPGGLAARVARHLKPKKSAHWHIDYLTNCIPPVAVLYATAAESRECTWVQRLMTQAGGFVPLRGFGNGDCRNGCAAHLIGIAHATAEPATSVVQRLSFMLQATVGEGGWT